jgi:hypothetical protein
MICTCSLKAKFHSSRRAYILSVLDGVILYRKRSRVSNMYVPSTPSTTQSWSGCPAVWCPAHGCKGGENLCDLPFHISVGGVQPCREAKATCVRLNSSLAFPTSLHNHLPHRQQVHAFKFRTPAAYSPLHGHCIALNIIFSNKERRHCLVIRGKILPPTLQIQVL